MISIFLDTAVIALIAAIALTALVHPTIPLRIHLIIHLQVPHALRERPQHLLVLAVLQERVQHPAYIQPVRLLQPILTVPAQ